jgi:hypothetical protein
VQNMVHVCMYVLRGVRMYARAYIRMYVVWM